MASPTAEADGSWPGCRVANIIFVTCACAISRQRLDQTCIIAEGAETLVKVAARLAELAAMLKLPHNGCKRDVSMHSNWLTCMALSTPIGFALTAFSTRGCTHHDNICQQLPCLGTDNYAQGTVQHHGVAYRVFYRGGRQSVDADRVWRQPARCHLMRGDEVLSLHTCTVPCNHLDAAQSS